MRWGASRLILLLLTLPPAPAIAQTINAARLAILQAEDRRAPTAADLATIRAGLRSGDALTMKVAVRALGHLERPELIPDILPALTNRFSEVRTEAADAVAQAVSGASPRPATAAAARVSPASLLGTLSARLEEEDDPGVRAALAESIGRLSYTDGDSIARAQRALVDLAARSTGVIDRLSVAKGFEALVRMHKSMVLTDAATQLLRALATRPTTDAAARPADPRQAVADPLKDARVRRLALQALMTADLVDPAVIAQGVADPDPQVRLLAVRAAGKQANGVMAVMGALKDRAASVRLEAVRALPATAGGEACAVTLGAVSDENPHVALQAIDQLSACGELDQAVERLAEMASDLAVAEQPRGWHRPAHALVALAGAAPFQARPLAAEYLRSTQPSLRLYAARAAGRLGDRPMLEASAADPDDNVAEAGIDGLARAAGGDATAVYLAALRRSGYQVIRAAARALESTQSADAPAAIAALKSALDRLVADGHANSIDVRTAIAATLTKLGAPPPPHRPDPRTADSPLTLADLKRLAAPRARITIRGVGVFDLALITFEAPATVLQFARLAERGYYNGLTFHRVAPNFVIQGGSPDANEYVGAPDHMRDELGLWPHVRGAVGISTRGRDTGDAQIFVDLVDSPLLDHRFTVFAQILNGMDVVDRILEGDVIENVRIVDGR